MPRLSAETDREEQCEGLVVTCAHCGRPATECDGTDCDDLLETRDWMVPGYSRKANRTAPVRACQANDQK